MPQGWRAEEGGDCIIHGPLHHPLTACGDCGSVVRRGAPRTGQRTSSGWHPWCRASASCWAPPCSPWTTASARRSRRLPGSWRTARCRPRRRLRLHLPSLAPSFPYVFLYLPHHRAAHLLAAPSGARPHEASVDPSICSLRGNDVSEDRYMLVSFGMICSFMYPAGEVSSCVDRARKLRS